MSFFSTYKFFFPSAEFFKKFKVLQQLDSFNKFILSLKKQIFSCLIGVLYIENGHYPLKPQTNQLG